MVPPRKEGESDRSSDGDVGEGFRANNGSESAQGGGVAERLRESLRGESDDDLSHEGSGGAGDDRVLPWLQALDLQVLGACRADERSKPLLKLNVCSDPAVEKLLAQLSQHFEASEVGMLARCLFVPLVSVRVGKVEKLGNILWPTATRGQLNLNLLPSSNMHISFTGDNGCAESLAVSSNGFDSSGVILEEISADTSGRSFLLKLPGPRVLYYWCSEKSKVHGLELLAKMKDLLQRKPSLSRLTGISESRLDSFATHLGTYLLGCATTTEANSAVSSHGLHGGSTPDETDCQFSSAVSQSCSRTVEVHLGQVHSVCQGGLNPRLSLLKDEIQRTVASTRSGSREKLKQHGDFHPSTLAKRSEPVASFSVSCTVNALCTSKCEDDNSRNTEPSLIRSCGLPEIPSLLSLPSFNPMSIHLSPSQTTRTSSLFSPYYCWCPPGPSSLQYKATSSHLSSMSEHIPLPPLSSLLPAAAPTVASVPAKLPIDVSELGAMTLPTLIPDALVPASFSVSSLTLPCSQQLPMFTPFISDPIVHIPVIDFCSSGPGYLVSAGPAISSVLSPLLPGLVSPLIPKAESAIEKNARETLKMLMASSPIASSPQLNVLPAIFNNLDESFSCAKIVNNHSAVVATSSQLLYGGTVDVDNVSSNLSCIGICSLGEGVAHELYHTINCNPEEDSCSDDYDELKEG